MQSRPLIIAKGLALMRGDRTLFRDVSLSLPPAAGLVLRGANGAGKTTLLRILAGLTRPEAGAVVRPVPLHWIGHRDGLKPHETPRQHTALWARAWGAEAGAAEAALQTVNILRAADVPARDLSAGQRKRAALARLHLVQRPLWLLDEPMSALDGSGRDALSAWIMGHIRAGGGVIMAVHGEAGFVPQQEMTL
jgi:heme exporter protein A